MRRYRVDIKTPSDPRLEAKFFYASSEQDAIEMAKRWLGRDSDKSRISAVQDKE